MSGTGVTFGTNHSYKAWGLKLKEIKIGLPEVKTSYVEVPGMNGSLDLTEATFGGVTYGMRTLEFSFDARNCNYKDWSSLITTIASAVHGQRLPIILDTDPEYYYTGRCELDTKKTNDVLAQITIQCYCEPYKLNVVASSGLEWEWDSFSFVDGVVRDTKDVRIDAATGWQTLVLVGWQYNSALEILSDTAMKIKFGGSLYAISAGKNVLQGIVLTEGKNKLEIQGVGVITAIYRGGML